MFRKISRGVIVGILVTIPLLALIWITLFQSEIGMARDIGVPAAALNSYDPALVPQSVIDDAANKAAELVGNNRGKQRNIMDQLLAMYQAAQGQDVIILFNSGGWGWNQTNDTPGWRSILDGITGELDRLGNQALVLNYQRTTGTPLGLVREFFEAATSYPHKSRDLVGRIEFLTEHYPDLKIIIAGESTGTVITAKTMDVLEENQRVYSVQTGTPFWYQPHHSERTLLMNSNGRGIDTFSYGNVPAMIWATVKGWLGMTSPDENPGDILSWLKAPGHHYSWEYPGVSSAVITFLDANFAKQ
jgi:hypothetical protein